ncbi:Adenylate cyclase, family 3 [Catenovulum agarivorans DS-2]|uniref:Adenylate cyclase, family 3 n=1 Tax=Catenovulum agarivorans DS-2 TaxID=1328313 RepID=W7QF95_9ALTE|nr:adenylate/guanylate cyclase domain-containing protein [Catenovulum agarivorans]EWH11574.1 Adenylate cyclase, family 3 [Catenovulum agarivorans DS-2]
MIKITSHRLAVLCGLLLTFLFILFQLSPPNTDARAGLNRLDGLLYDIRFNLLLPHRPRYTDNNIVIIDIDEKSIREQGRFPWSRSKTAKMVDKLFEAGVAVIAFDVMFSEEEVNPVDFILAKTAKSAIVEQHLLPYRDELDPDTQLARSISQGDVILGVLFEEQLVAMSGRLPDSPIVLEPAVDAKKVKAFAKPAFVGVVDTLFQAAKESGFTISQGFINSTPDEDGSIRRAALVIRHQDKLYSSLALEAVRAYLFEEKIKVRTETFGGQHNIVAVELNKKQIPTDQHGHVLVPYRGGKQSFDYVSATDVIKGIADIDKLAGAIAFIGTSSVGLADLRETPVGIQYPGVEVHANVAEALLHPDVLKFQPDIANELVVVILTVIGLLASCIMPKLGSIKMASMGVFLLVLSISVNLILWHFFNMVLPLFTILALVVSLTIVNVAIGYVAESNQKKVIKGFFDQYVPPAHIDKMLSDPSSVSFDGERKVMSVLFSDIRSFTTISENLSATELKQLLNQYFSPITKSILDHKGTIDKYVGDMVMAFWGAPLDDPNHANHAITAAFAMLEITEELNISFVEQGFPEIAIGIGINSGEMNVGDMGSEFRRAYTVLGDAVNLGSRLEGLTKFYGVKLLVSEATQELADDYVYRPIDRVKVKGKNQAVAIAEPICRFSELTEQDKDELTLHLQAYDHYLSQDWQQAGVSFSHLTKQYPARKLYKIYLERIDELQNQDFIENWDGSFTHTSK